MTTISEKPWSDYTAADYSLEQWHKACLIHLHDGDPTSKSQCKLPVRTPQGTLNRNGVHAAASVLAGGRGGVNAPADKIAAAKRVIVGLYGQLDEEPPDSMKQSDEEGTDFDIDELLEYVVEHHGVKGQKWGVRRNRRQLDASSQHVSVNRHPDAQRAHDIATQQKTQGTHSLSNQDLQTLITRMNLEQQFGRLSSTHQNAGKRFVKELLVGVGKEHAKNLATKASTQAGKKILAKAVAKKAARAAVKVATGV